MKPNKCCSYFSIIFQIVWLIFCYCFLNVSLPTVFLFLFFLFIVFLKFIIFLSSLFKLFFFLFLVAYFFLHKNLSLPAHSFIFLSFFSCLISASVKNLSLSDLLFCFFVPFSIFFLLPFVLFFTFCRHHFSFSLLIQTAF